MSRFEQYLDEAKNMSNTMIGFGIEPNAFKRITSYIKSWLIRYKIDYEQVKEPHFSISQIVGTYSKDELIREIHKIDSNMNFKPKDLKIFRGKNIPKDFIVLEYKPNDKFVKAFKTLKGKYEVRDFGSIKPHISLFTIEPGAMTDELFDDLKFSLPKIPTVKPVKKALWNKKFKVEYKE